MKKWMPNNPYPGEQEDFDFYLPQFTSMRRAYDQGFLDGTRQGFNEGCQAQARKIVEWLWGMCDDGEHFELLQAPTSRTHCPYCMGQLRKEVGL